MIKFAKVKRFENEDLNLPIRKTAHSAGYDFEVAEDIIIPPYSANNKLLLEFINKIPKTPDLKEVARMTKETGARPTLVPTGIKCHLDEGYYLELSMRSSTPLKYWLVMANSVGIIDADYADNPDNDGEIFFQVINFGPTKIKLHKGDVIGQGIIKRYEVTDDDKAEGVRTGGFGSTSKKEN